MSELAQSVLSTFGRLDLRALLDIIIVALIIYWFLVLLRGTTAMSLLRGIATLLILAFIFGSVFRLNMLNLLLRNSLTALLVAIPILFQPELRRALERIGRPGFRESLGRSATARLVDTVVTASRRLADRRYGALMVLERETGLQDVIDTGVELDAASSVDLLVNIFFPNSPLHDGAVILRDGRVVAAGCVLPLSSSTSAPVTLGTRHRAGLGITERTDAVSVIVSEETGHVSLAHNGELTSNLDDSRLRRLLLTIFGVSGSRAAGWGWLSGRAG